MLTQIYDVTRPEWAKGKQLGDYIFEYSRKHYPEWMPDYLFDGKTKLKWGKAEWEGMSEAYSIQDMRNTPRHYIVAAQWNVVFVVIWLTTLWSMSC